MTQEEILKRMLNRVPNTFDKREGSVIFDADSTSSYEFAQAYSKIDYTLKQTFAGTADREGLILCCAEIGIQPMEATRAIRKMLTTPAELEINIGERFSFEDLNFIVVDKIENGAYQIECEEYGTVGNHGTGNLIPINYINGLETATLVDEVIIYGEDEEETEALRARYFATLPTMTLDGNIAQYKKWCNGFAGIGNYKIFPEWNGKNTVKVSILSSENTLASEELIASFQEYLDPESEGLGMGIAPIGAVVTVSTATEKNLIVNAIVILKEGYIEPIGAEEAINSYLKGLNYSRDRISYVAISALINQCEGVDVVVECTVNGEKTDIMLENEEIGKLESFTFEVV